MKNKRFNPVQPLITGLLIYSIVINFNLYESNTKLTRENEKLSNQLEIFVTANEQIADIPRHNPRGI